MFDCYETKVDNFVFLLFLKKIVNRTYEQELTDDLISIIHYYSMKYTVTEENYIR